MLTLLASQRFAAKRWSVFCRLCLAKFFFFTIAAGALGVAFMPYLSDRLHKGDNKGVWELSTSLVNLLSIIMSLMGVFMFIFADVLVHTVVAHGLTPANNTMSQR